MVRTRRMAWLLFSPECQSWRLRVLRAGTTHLVAGGKVKLTICRKMWPSNRYILGLTQLLMMWLLMTEPSGSLKLSSINVRYFVSIIYTWINLLIVIDPNIEHVLTWWSGKQYENSWHWQRGKSSGYSARLENRTRLLSACPSFNDIRTGAINFSNKSIKT